MTDAPLTSGLLQNIFPDGTIEYDGQVGLPSAFPLTEAELQEINNAGSPIAPVAPLPDYRSFWLALIGTDLYAAIKDQASSSLVMNTLATELITLLSDAKSGLVLEAAIQQSMDSILATGTFTEYQLSELQLALIVGHLDQTYTINTPEP